MNNNLKEIIESKKGFKIGETLKQQGIRSATFYDIANGKQVPRIDTAYKIINALGLRDEDIHKIFPNVYKQKIT